VKKHRATYKGWKNKREREIGRGIGTGYVKELYIAHKRQKEKPDLFSSLYHCQRSQGGTQHLVISPAP